MMFKRFKNETIPTNSGDRVKIKYTLKYEGNNKKLVPIDEIDIQEQINSHEEECSLKHYLTKFGVSSDARLLVAERLNKNGVYADTTVFPKDLIEVQEKASRVKDFVDNLPDQVVIPQKNDIVNKEEKQDNSEVNENE